MPFLKKHSYISIISLLLLILVFSFPKIAYGYIDPGVGSIVIQAVVGVIVGAGFFIKIFWKKIKAFFTKLFSKKNQQIDEKSSQIETSTNVERNK